MHAGVDLLTGVRRSWLKACTLVSIDSREVPIPDLSCMETDVKACYRHQSFYQDVKIQEMTHLALLAIWGHISLTSCSSQ